MGGAVIKALSQLLGASYMDGIPSDECRDIWREMVAEARREHDALRARVAELEAECTRQFGECERFKAQRDEAAARAGRRLAERDAALATLERVREALGHEGPAIDTLARVEDALASPG